MALIERFTPGGNLYPDGSSTFATLVSAFRRQAEARDAVDASLLASAKAEATALANGVKDQAVAAASANTVTIAAEAEARAKGYAEFAAGAARADALSSVDGIDAPAASVNFLTGTATQEGLPAFHDSVLALAPTRYDAAGRAVVERASENKVPTAHQTFAGAVVGVRGSGGALPTGWSETFIDGTVAKVEIQSVTTEKLRLRIFKTSTTASTSQFAVNMPARPGYDLGASPWGGFTTSARVRVVSQTPNVVGVRLKQDVHSFVNNVTTYLRGTNSPYVAARDGERTLSTWTQVNAGERVNLALVGSIESGKELEPYEVVVELSKVQAEAGQTAADYTTYAPGAKPASTLALHIPPGAYSVLVQRGNTQSGYYPNGVTSNKGGVWHDITVTGNTGWSLPAGVGSQFVDQIHAYRGTLTNAQRTAVSDRVSPIQYTNPVIQDKKLNLDGNIATVGAADKPYTYKHAGNRRYVERWEVREGDHYANDSPGLPSSQRVERAEWAAHESPVPWQVPIWHSMQIRIEPGLVGDGLQMSSNIIIGQWHATEDFISGNTREAAREPVTALYITDGNTVKYDIRWTDVQVMQPTTPLNALTVMNHLDFPRGQFVHVLQKITFDWRSDGIGRTEMWVDGQKMADVTRPVGYNDVLGPHWKQGIYRAPGTNKGRAVVTYANTQWGTADLSHLIGNPPPIS